MLAELSCFRLVRLSVRLSVVTLTLFMFQDNFIEFVWFRHFEGTFLFESPIWARYVRIYSEYYASDDYVRCHKFELIGCLKHGTVLPDKSDSDDVFCLQTYQGLIIDRSLVYQS